MVNKNKYIHIKIEESLLHKFEEMIKNENENTLMSNKLTKSNLIRSFIIEYLDK